MPKGECREAPNKLFIGDKLWKIIQGPKIVGPPPKRYFLATCLFFGLNPLNILKKPMKKPGLFFRVKFNLKILKNP